MCFHGLPKNTSMCNYIQFELQICRYINISSFISLQPPLSAVARKYYLPCPVKPKPALPTQVKHKPSLPQPVHKWAHA